MAVVSFLPEPAEDSSSFQSLKFFHRQRRIAELVVENLHVTAFSDENGSMYGVCSSTRFSHERTLVAMNSGSLSLQSAFGTPLFANSSDSRFLIPCEVKLREFPSGEERTSRGSHLAA